MKMGETKTYEEALEMVKDYASSMSGILREHNVRNGTFALIGHFIGGIYNVSDEKIIEDFQIEKNGITYKLIKID